MPMNRQVVSGTGGLALRVRGLRAGAGRGARLLKGLGQSPWPRAWRRVFLFVSSSPAGRPILSDPPPAPPRRIGRMDIRKLMGPGRAGIPGRRLVAWSDDDPEASTTRTSPMIALPDLTSPATSL